MRHFALILAFIVFFSTSVYAGTAFVFGSQVLDAGNFDVVPYSGTLKLTLPSQEEWTVSNGEWLLYCAKLDEGEEKLTLLSLTNFKKEYIDGCPNGTYSLEWNIGFPLKTCVSAEIIYSDNGFSILKSEECATACEETETATIKASVDGRVTKFRDGSYYFDKSAHSEMKLGNRWGDLHRLFFSFPTKDSGIPENAEIDSISVMLCNRFVSCYRNKCKDKVDVKNFSSELLDSPDAKKIFSYIGEQSRVYTSADITEQKCHHIPLDKKAVSDFKEALSGEETFDISVIGNESWGDYYGVYMRGNKREDVTPTLEVKYCSEEEKVETCSDSDDGTNLEVRGYCQVGEEGEKVTDKCKGNTLIEVVCSSDNECGTVEFECIGKGFDACEGGRCIKTEKREHFKRIYPKYNGHFMVKDPAGRGDIDILEDCRSYNRMMREGKSEWAYCSCEVLQGGYARLHWPNEIPPFVKLGHIDEGWGMYSSRMWFHFNFKDSGIPENAEIEKISFEFCEREWRYGKAFGGLYTCEVDNDPKYCGYVHLSVFDPNELLETETDLGGGKYFPDNQNEVLDEDHQATHFMGFIESVSGLCGYWKVFDRIFQGSADIASKVNLFERGNRYGCKAVNIPLNTGYGRKLVQNIKEGKNIVIGLSPRRHVPYQWATVWTKNAYDDDKMPRLAVTYKA